MNSQAKISSATPAALTIPDAKTADLFSAAEVSRIARAINYNILTLRDLLTLASENLPDDTDGDKSRACLNASGQFVECIYDLENQLYEMSCQAVAKGGAK